MHRNLSKQVDYHPSVSAYIETPLTKQIQLKQIRRTKSLRESKSLNKNPPFIFTTTKTYLQFQNQNNHNNKHRNLKRSTSYQPHYQYNKWYIKPQQQFMQTNKFIQNGLGNGRESNINKSKEKDEEFIYRNLHNFSQSIRQPQIHPKYQKLSSTPLAQEPVQNPLDKLDEKILEGFKKFIQEAPGQRRLPSIVQYLLAKKTNVHSKGKGQNTE